MPHPEVNRPPPPGRAAPRLANRVWRMVGSFAAMYLIATVVGFVTYRLISPTAMWVSVFTLMPVIAASLIYWYLRAAGTAPEASLAESTRLVLVWIGLSFALDAPTYVRIVPAATHTPPNWTFFRDQSPWIWLSYAVLAVSGGVGRWAYLRRRAS